MTGTSAPIGGGFYFQVLGGGISVGTATNGAGSFSVYEQVSAGIAAALGYNWTYSTSDGFGGNPLAAFGIGTITGTGPLATVLLYDFATGHVIFAYGYGSSDLIEGGIYSEFATVEDFRSWYAQQYGQAPILPDDFPNHEGAVNAAPASPGTTSFGFEFSGVEAGVLAGTSLDAFLPSAVWPADGIDWDWSTVSFSEASLAVPVQGGSFDYITVPGISVVDATGSFTGTFAQTSEGNPMWQVAAQSYNITQTAVANQFGGYTVYTNNGNVTGQFNYAGPANTSAGPLSYFGNTAGNEGRCMMRHDNVIIDAKHTRPPIDSSMRNAAASDNADAFQMHVAGAGGV